ncbi:hypothetical protein PVAP13_8KG052402 [Panicum virgatum]|uniref:Uncharacterized protein n=1 Tax=Panicum virgatum TaxID=38727 RepID=A0A8T0PDA0_PANVG|nr:hypothetical protein PVAP13_8KG052402 [Panicum virgatum]
MWKCFFHSIHKLLALESYKPLCSIVLRSPPTFFPSYCNHKEKDQFTAQIIGITSRIKRFRSYMQGIFTMSGGYLHKQSTKCSVWRRPWRRRSGGPTGRPLFGAAVLARRSREAVARGNWFCWVRDCGSAGGQGGGAQVGRQVQAQIRVLEALHSHWKIYSRNWSCQENLSNFMNLLEENGVDLKEVDVRFHRTLLLNSWVQFLQK